MTGHQQGEVPTLQVPGGDPGHLLDQSGIWPLPVRLEAIAKYPRLSTCSQLLSFLGVINFYRRFIRGLPASSSR